MNARFLTAAALLLLQTLTLWANAKRPVVRAESKLLNAGYIPAGGYVDLVYLIEHIRMFEGVDVVTNGTVRFCVSFYMFEDFWLEAPNKAKIPAVVRFSGLPRPPEGRIIEVSGKIQYSRLEGGFYFLNATSWKIIEAPSIPSLPSTNHLSSNTSQLEETPQETLTPQELSPQGEGEVMPQSPEPSEPMEIPLKWVANAIAAVATIIAVTVLVLKVRGVRQKSPFWASFGEKVGSLEVNAPQTLIYTKIPFL